MKKISKSLIVIIGIVLVLGLMLKNSYNSMVTQDEGVNKAWGAVENAYQRRLDLIPSLVSTVQQATSYEKETLTAVIDARSKATAVQIDPTNITPEKLAEYQAGMSGVNSALGRLMAVVEKYPDLKANQNILSLQNQLEGTENRIKIDRDNFNKVVADYNTTVRKFPTNLFAGMMGFSSKGMFKSDEGANKAPDVGALFNKE